MTVRPPAVAGRFYPGEAGALADLVDRLLDSVAVPDGEPPAVGYVVPHAGYRYSGPTAAHAYARLRGAAVVGAAGVAATRFVIAGPAHRAPVRGCVVPAASAWATPLGEVPVDVAGVAALADAGLATVDDGPLADEHSLEVQLPFLQRIVAGPFSILPIAVGLSTVDDSAATLAAAAGPGTVVVCSTDLSHYQDEATAMEQDAGTVRAVLELAPARIAATDACGAFALRGLLGYARTAGLSPVLLDRSTSARASGDTGRVVGYASFAFTGHPADAPAT
jgi:AmmeMemoRadiSam system protein B